MIFFPGGAYHGGGARGASEIEPSYDGGRLAAKGAVVVTANYRLGMLGFLAHPELSAESAHHVSGNYALLDQIAAMRWVKDNIAKFGGDPANVTISGQSAGSYSIGFLMTSPLARPLFAKAIGFSGTVADFRLGAGGLKDAEGAGAKFLTSLGAPDKGAIAALRAKPARALFQTMMASEAIHAKEPRGPVVDGYAFPRNPAEVFREGREAQVPFMVGNTARDGDVDSMGVKGTAKADAMIANKARPLASTHKVAALSPEGRKQIENYYAAYPDLAKKAVALYSNAAATDPVDGDAITAFDTDIFFRCGAALTASWHARAAPTYRYEFSHGYEPLGGVHLWDMMYVFGWTEGAADRPRDKKLVDQEQAYLINFLKNGDPNGPGLPSWKKNSDADAYMDFASAGATPGTGLRAAACALYADKAARDRAKAAR
jgi:para-nitrobenzyl esterase